MEQNPAAGSENPFSETGAIVLSWIVLAGGGLTRKATYLLYGNNPG